jgi:penicillin-binding protein 1A
LAPEAVSQVLSELAGIVDPDSLQRGGYTIHTTVDPVLQKVARKAVLDGLTEIDKRHNRLAPYEPMNNWPQGNRGLDGNLKEGQTYVAEVTGHDDTNNRVEAKIAARRGWIDLGEAARYNPQGLKASKFAAKGAKLHVSLAQKPVAGKDLKLHLEIGPQAALVAINPKDGSIAAMIGGDAALGGGFNRATAAKRQPGSAFKPFVYLAAIHSGRYTAATLLDDAPEIQGQWQPQNTESGAYEGPVLLRRALAHSINMPAVKLITDIGPAEVVGLAGRMGITSKLEPAPSLALGASVVSPLDLAAAFSVFAAQGKLHTPWIVEKVTGPDGVDIPLLGRAPKQVITEQEAYVMTSLLESVIQEGTGAAARSLARPAAGKTGTSNSERDTWFAGYTADWVCVVWVGYDDYRPVGRREYGGRCALPIWLDFMKQVHASLPKRDFAVPEGIVTALIDPMSGLLAYDGMQSAVEEIFIEGTEPTEKATPPDLVSLGGFLLDQAAGDAGPDAGSGER